MQESDEKYKKEIKERVSAYFRQFTAGCNRPICENSLCAKNPDFPRLDPTSACTLAIEHATDQEHLCSPAPPFCTLSSVKSLIEAVNKGEIPLTVLMDKINEIFGSPSSLNYSFLMGPANPQSHGIDINELEQGYALIAQHPKDGVRNGLIHGVESLIKNARFNIKSFTSPSSLRIFEILFHFAFIYETENYRLIFGPFLSCIGSLSNESKEILCKWWSQLEKTIFSRRIMQIHNFITLRCYETDVHNDEYIQSAVKVLDIFHKANKMAGCMITFSDFYNEPLSENIQPDEDYVAWKLEQNKFSFCRYPFVLNPFMKSLILRCDSLYKMRIHRQQSFQRLWSGNFDMPFFVLKVRREQLRRDALSQLQRRHDDPFELKKQLKVQFIGEEGIDEGGVQKEFFQLILKELFSLDFGMFVYSNDSHNLWFNSNSEDFADFELIGIIIGLAIYNGVILDIHFPFVVYKKLMGMKPEFDDLKDISPALWKGLRHINADNVEELDLYFQVESNYFGEVRSHELKPNGANIRVNKENYHEYIDLYVKWTLEESVKKQFDKFLQGFKIVCDGPLMELFEPQELELLVCGEKVLDFESLEKSTRYEGYDKDHPTVKYFWEVLHSLPEEKKKRFLFFTTGSDRSPIGGLKNLRFIIMKHGDSPERLPQAQTCYNVLLLPEYKAVNILRERLLTAIDNAEGFGMR